MPTEKIIEVNNLCKSFGDKEVVSKVNLDVNKGEIYGFLGPNGSGKTTMIRMICGLLSPTSGSGTCLGLDIIRNSQAIKEQVGYMTQRFSLYEDLSIRENLEFIARVYGLTKRCERVQASIEQLGFGAARANQLAGTLSGGWKQRLALAAVMLHKPKLLLLDEPTAGVDPQARREFWQQIHAFSAQGITTLVSTHYMDEAEQCHRLGYIAYGKLLATGTINEIIKSSGLITWEASEGDVHQLLKQLAGCPGVDQVAVFGRSLHVIGKHDTQLEEAIRPYLHQFNWKKINASLEDVFIHLVNQAKDNFA